MKRVARRKRSRHGLPFVQQLGPPEPDCGVACVAMIAGTDYTEAWLYANTVSEHWDYRGMTTKNVIDALAMMTGKQYRYWRLPSRTLLVGFDRWPAVNAAVVIRRAGDRWGHWIAWDSETRRILDPSLIRPLRLETYAAKLIPDVRLIGFVLPREDAA